MWNNLLVYEIWKDMANGEFWSAWEKTLVAIRVPEECYVSTFTFVSVFVLIICIIAINFPRQTVNVVKTLLDVKEEPETPTPAVNVIFSSPNAGGRRIQNSTATPEDEDKKKNDTKRKSRITKKYSTFTPVVLDIMGTHISDTEKIDRIYNAIKQLLNVESVIGYEWEKRILKNGRIQKGNCWRLLLQCFPESEHIEY